MAGRRSAEEQETPEDRWLLEAQTARNLEALTAEQAGEVERAIALYERNVAEGFVGDLPYGRLVMLYERRGALEDAERVLRRAIEGFETSQRRTAGDRGGGGGGFKNRGRRVLVGSKSATSRPSSTAAMKPPRMAPTTPTATSPSRARPRARRNQPHTRPPIRPRATQMSTLTDRKSVV